MPFLCDLAVIFLLLAQRMPINPLCNYLLVADFAVPVIDHRRSCLGNHLISISYCYFNPQSVCTINASSLIALPRICTAHDGSAHCRFTLKIATFFSRLAKSS